MNALLERSSQAVSVTEVSRSAKTIFDRLSSGKQEKYVVMWNNAPAAVKSTVPRASGFEILPRPEKNVVTLKNPDLLAVETGIKDGTKL